jgi:integrase
MVARLTDTHARNAKPKSHAYKLIDGGGLHLLVRPNGTKSWQYRYRVGEKENLYTIGRYPSMGMQQARVARDAARELVRQGMHPSVQRRADRLVTIETASNTFESVAREWIAQNRSGWTPYYLRQVETMLAADVFPHVGALPIKSVKSAQLLAILRRVAGRDASTVAILLRQWCSAIFRYAVTTLRADFDPAAALKGAIKRPRVKHKRALGMNEIAELREKVAASSTTPQVKIALELLLYTFVRPGELRGAIWSEFDLEKAEWRIPAERMKMRTPHVVPLANQVIPLRELCPLCLGRERLFPNVRDPKRVMSNTTLNRVLTHRLCRRILCARLPGNGVDALNEHGYRSDVIERQLAHQERNGVRASYNHATYLAERRKMMQEWADMLDAAQASGGAQ